MCANTYTSTFLFLLDVLREVGGNICSSIISCFSLISFNLFISLSSLLTIIRMLHFWKYSFPVKLVFRVLRASETNLLAYLVYSIRF